MNILILTEGGKDIGFGHLTRCVALYQAFEEEGITPVFLINSDSSADHILKNQKYKIFNWLKEKDNLFKLFKNVDIAVIDSYLADFNLYKKITELVKTVVYMDDYNRIKYPKGMVVNGAVYAKQLRYPKGRNITYFLGSRYMPLRKEFWDVPRKTINKEIKDILITFGGMKQTDLIDNVIWHLKCKFNFNKIYSIKNKAHVKEMLNFMLKADLCISGGGQTTYELVKCGVPTIGVCFAKNQILNLEGWERVGCLQIAGWYNDKNLLKNIEDTLIQLDYKKRVEMSHIGRKSVDGLGGKRIVKQILELSKL